jgi:hypothetical protein
VLISNITNNTKFKRISKFKYYKYQNLILHLIFDIGNCIVIFETFIVF